MITRAGLAIAVALLVGCGPGPGSVPIIDTWPVGDLKSCAIEDARCAALMPAAIAGYDAAHPGHAAIVRATLHDEGPVFDAGGRRVLVTRSGSCCSVAVFVLEDGSVGAIGVGYPGVSQTPEAVLHGP